MWAILAVLAIAGNAPEDSAVGSWRSPTKHALISVAQCGDSLCGTLVTSDDIVADPSRRDVKNSDEKLRSRRLAGVPMLGGDVSG